MREQKEREKRKENLKPMGAGPLPPEQPAAQSFDAVERRDD